MDKAKFYAALRRKNSGVFSTRLFQHQVDALEVILDEGRRRGLPLRHLAYVLATPYHEVGPALKPVRENLYYTSVASIRKVWPSRFPSNASAQPYVRQPQKLANHVYGGRLGNTGPNDGWLYRGGGWPQTTGKVNYERSGKLVGVDLVKNPDRMLEPKIAAVTMIESMVQGLYTGKKLSDYLNKTPPDYRNARAIINADVAKNGSTIAGYAKAFETALTEAGYEPAPLKASETIAIPVTPEKVMPTMPKKDTPVSDSLIATVQTLLRLKGYPEVGEPDNIFGSRTRNAILAFQADNDLDLTGEVTDDLLASIIKAPERINALARETATAKDLKDAGVPVVKPADWLQKIGVGVLTATGLGTILEGTASFEQITQSLNNAQRLIETVTSFGPWVLLGAGGIAAIFIGRKILKEQVSAYREGRVV